MLPKTHLISSLVVVAVLSSFYDLGAFTFLLWLSVAGIAALAVDIDHLFFPLLKKEKWHVMKKIIRDPLYIPRNPRAFVDEIHFRGLGVIRLWSHTVWGVLIYLFTESAYPLIVPPVMASIATHLVLDIIETIAYPDRR